MMVQNHLYDVSSFVPQKLSRETKRFVQFFYEMIKVATPGETPLMKFKLHVLLHYARAMRLIGPLLHYATFRYERKHSQPKRETREMYNFKNPAYTIVDYVLRKTALAIDYSPVHRKLDQKY